MSNLKFNASLNLIYRENENGTVDIIVRGVSEEDLGLYVAIDLFADYTPRIDGNGSPLLLFA